jgi:hypothetical protein
MSEPHAGEEPVAAQDRAVRHTRRMTESSDSASVGVIHDTREACRSGGLRRRWKVGTLTFRLQSFLYRAALVGGCNVQPRALPQPCSSSG